MTTESQCQFCKAAFPAYVCPRCMAPYCSLSCYKRKEHANCSERFYRECIETEMRQQTTNESDTKKIKEALVRERQAASDDHQLESRLASVNLDNTEEVLQALTDEERTTFERLVESNEIAKYISLWQPWWEQPKTLVQEVKPVEEQNNLAGFKRQRKVTRPKISGRKVKDLSSKTTLVNQVNKATKQDNTKSDTLKPNDSISEQLQSGVTTTKAHEEADCNEIIRLNESDTKTTPVVAVDPQREQKTRIVDKRYHEKRMNPIEPHCKERHDEEHTGVVSNISNRDSAKEIKVGDSGDNAETVSSNESEGRKQNLLLDSWVKNSSESDHLPGWGDREKILASNLVNMLTAFAFVARFFNGDWTGAEIDAADTLQTICAAFRGQNFQAAEIAISDVLLHEVVMKSANSTTLVTDVSLLLGTAEYVQRGLSEMRSLLKAARRSLDSRSTWSPAESSEVGPDGESSPVNMKQNEVSSLRKQLKLFMLKLDFYQNWVMVNIRNLQKSTLQAIEREKERLLLSRASEEICSINGNIASKKKSVRFSK